MIKLFELEEWVGELWHRWASDCASYPEFPDARVDLQQVQGALKPLFHLSGGEAGLQLASAGAGSYHHRLSLRQRLGFEAELLVQTSRDSDCLSLPGSIALYPDAALNRRLYFWLAVFMGCAVPTQPRSDPLQQTLAELAATIETLRRVQRKFPAIANYYHPLCDGLRQVRPARDLPETEAALEAVILHLLGAEQPLTPLAESLLDCVEDGFEAPELLGRWQAPGNYRPPLPVPLWGLATTAPRVDESDNSLDNNPDEEAGDSENVETPPPATGERRKANRQQYDQAERDDPLMFNRFEKMLSFTEMLNINRHVDDDPYADAQKAADQLEEFHLTRHDKTPGSRIRAELELPARAIDTSALSSNPETLYYPEWDYRTRALRPQHCAVKCEISGESAEQDATDDQLQTRIRRVQRQFESLHPRRTVLRAQQSGDELDTDAAVQAYADHRATGWDREAIYLAHRQQARDLAVDLLVDVSLSTDAWLEDRRIIDVAREAVQVFAHGLARLGDEFAIHSFTSQRRHKVWVRQIKGFAERFDGRVERRIQALRPGHYTRMGAAIRHISALLKQRPERHRLLLLLTDGKPSDNDYYEGRYAVEDTRQAVLAARREGIRIFAITIDRNAQSYIRHLFGPGGYALVERPEKLALALPKIYRQITRD